VLPVSTEIAPRIQHIGRGKINITNFAPLWPRRSSHACMVAGITGNLPALVMTRPFRSPYHRIDRWRPSAPPPRSHHRRRPVLYLSLTPAPYPRPLYCQRHRGTSAAPCDSVLAESLPDQFALPGIFRLFRGHYRRGVPCKKPASEEHPAPGFGVSSARCYCPTCPGGWCHPR
jgi:hypothetical protein